MITIKVETSKEFYRIYTGAKKWYLVEGDGSVKLYDTVAFSTDSEPRWADFPIFRTITDIEIFDEKYVIISLK